MKIPPGLTLELLENKRIAVAFPYNEEVISQLRTLSDRRWDPENRRWEVGISQLYELMEIFKIPISEIDRRLLRCYQMYRIRHGRAKITAGNVNAILSGVNLPLDKIDRALSMQVPSYRFMTRYKKGKWDGKRHLFRMEDQSFPSGMTARVARVLSEAAIDCDIIWEDNGDAEPGDLFNGIETPPAPALRSASSATPAVPSRKTESPKKTDNLILRDYQLKCVNAAVAERRGIIEVATGGGETLIAAHIIRKIGRPALFLVHTRDLLYQAIDVLTRELNIPIGCVGDGRQTIETVTVATVQTAARALEIKIDQCPDDDEQLQPESDCKRGNQDLLGHLLKTVPVVIFDECHRLPAETAYGLAMELKGAAWRYGLSATPYRADRQEMLMEAALGPKFYCARASFLIEQGYLVPPRVKFLAVPPAVAKTTRTDYEDIYQSYIVENKDRNRLIVEAARDLMAEGKSVLILVNHLRHGSLLSELLGRAPMVQGNDSMEVRKKRFADLAAKTRLVMIATTLADEGLDLPTLDAVILAGGGRSETRALQRIGRALRPCPDKVEAIVIDFMDNAPYLREHAANRLELYKSEPRFIVEY